MVSESKEQNVIIVVLLKSLMQLQDNIQDGKAYDLMETDMFYVGG